MALLSANCIKSSSMQQLTFVKPSVLPLICPSHSCAKAVVGTSSGPDWSNRQIALLQEFLERLRIFRRKCEIIREKNALKIAKGREVRFLPSLPLFDSSARDVKQLCLMRLVPLLSGSCS